MKTAIYFIFVMAYASQVLSGINLTGLIGVETLRHNVELEIKKDSSLRDLCLMYSFNESDWNELDETSTLNDDYFYAGIHIDRALRTICLRFADFKPGQILKKGEKYYISQTFEVSVQEKRTTFLEFNFGGFTKDKLPSSSKEAEEFKSQPNIYKMNVIMYEYIATGNEGSLMLRLTKETVEWSFDTLMWPVDKIKELMNSIVKYSVKIGEINSNAFFSQETSESVMKLPKLPTGRYWIRVSGIDKKGNEVIYGTQIFAIICDGDKTDVDSDCDGFTDSEELAYGTDKDDPNDTPVIIMKSDAVETINGNAGQYVSVEFKIRGNAKVRWEASGNIPEGLVLDNYGKLYGIPKSAGAFQLKIKATDVQSFHFDMMNVYLVIGGGVQSQIVPGEGKR